MSTGPVPVLTTQRATLRAWTVDDAEHLFAILSIPDVVAWLDQAPLPDISAAREKIEQNRGRATAAIPGSRAIVPHDLGRPIGASILGRFAEGDPEVNIGWHLHPDHTGNGWATEAAAAVLAEALANGHPRVWANMWSHNDASAAVCRRLGMPEIGVVDDPWHGTLEYPTSRFFCVENPDASDGLTPADVLADRLSRAEFKPATFHPPPRRER